jgi:hypothetical protein
MKAEGRKTMKNDLAIDNLGKFGAEKSR